MLDSGFNPWLIEVNATPAMDYSTPVTERLVKMMSEDTVKVLVDYDDAIDKQTVDTGLWNLLEKGTYVSSMPKVELGFEIEAVGKQIIDLS